MKKKFLAFVLAIVIVLGLLPVSAFASENNGKKGRLDYRYVAFSVDMPESKQHGPKAAKAAKTNGTAADDTIYATSALPSGYSSVTTGKTAPVKDQNPDGTCWACSATAVCETGLNASTGNVTSLSTLQLVNFFYNTKNDPLGNATGDKTANLSDTKLDQGGNHIFTMWGLAGWVNGAAETTFPYNSTNRTAVNNGTVAAKYANDYDIAHLQNAYIIPYSTSAANLSAVKEAIQTFGSVACSYYHDDRYYNSATGAYYCKLSSSNHAVSIVGWNDNYPASYFRTAPAGNGAWLVKNSWGSNWGTDGDSDPTNSGMEGYFWISYYDASLAYNQQVYAFDFHPVSEYKYNYQYDGSCGIQYVSVASGEKTCAMYTVKGLSSAAEKIKAVGVGVYSTDMSGTAYIYANPDADKPLSGELVATQNFTTSYAGYYTVELDDAPVLNAGDTFSVVIKWNKSGQIFVDSTYTNGNWIGFTANTANDKTYSVSSTGKITNYASNGQTARVKAYTVDATAAPAVPTYTVSFNANGGTNAPAAQKKTEGKTLTLSSTVPTRSGYEFLGWALTADATAPVYQPGDAYTVDADVVLYAVWNKLNIQKSVNVSVNVTSATTGKNKKQTTTYTAKITATATGTTVATVQYSKDSGATWTTGTSFTSNSNITSFMVKVTDADGEVYYFKYSNGTVTRQDPPAAPTKSVTASVSIKTVTSGKGKNKTTSYQTTISTSATATTVKTVQYSLNNGSTWTTGTSFTSTTKPTTFLIRVTDADGTVWNFEYSNGAVVIK